MFKWNKFLLLALLVIVQLTAFAQEKTGIKDEGIMRSEGKIYVVLAVVVTILAGLILYVSRLDRKISKLEKGDH
jgi:hypothetical protein